MKKAPAACNRRHAGNPSQHDNLVEVAPGLRVEDLPRELPPEIGLTNIQPMGDGTYKLILKVYDSLIRASESNKLLGVPNDIIMRLIRSGFVNASQVAPGMHLVNKTSWFEHVAAVRADPEFWLKEKNRRRYREAL